ncbi:MAG: tryptophan synthase subunit alpha [Ginsengibacter sp.]
MNRIEALFSAKKKNILSIYCTAGFPKFDSTTEVLLALQQYGADMVEIGIPYSDPLADGPVIQQSSMTALKNGMTIHKLFDQLKNLRLQVSPSGDRGSFNLPLILMGYLNPVMQYGFEKFCTDAKAVGVDGIILPDLPLYEFETEYKEIFKRNELDFIFLITPETSAERIKKIDELSEGFIYAVSSSSTTGKDTDMVQQQNYFKRLQQMKLRNPILVGFGIRDKETFKSACEYTNGAIIGSAYIKALQNSDDINCATEKFLNEILK